MRNFKQKQHKLSNNHVQFSNRNLLCKFEPPSKKSWIRPCLYHLFYFIYMGQPIWDPYGTRLHCPYGSHMGAHMGPIWVPYRLLAGSFHLVLTKETSTSLPYTVYRQRASQVHLGKQSAVEIHTLRLTVVFPLPYLINKL